MLTWATSHILTTAPASRGSGLVPWWIGRVETADTHIVRIVPTEPARPFFAWAELETDDLDSAGVAPPNGLRAFPSDSGAGLEDYAVA